MQALLTAVSSPPVPTDASAVLKIRKQPADAPCVAI